MESKLKDKKMKMFLFILSGIFIILILRLSYLQLVQTDRFQTLARENRIRINPINAPRGEIFDRKNVRLVGNRPIYTVSLEYLGIKDTSSVVKRLANILGIDPKSIEDKINAQKLKLYQPVEVAVDVPVETLTKIEEKRLELPGVIIDVEPVREYPFGSSLSHVLGYVQEIKEKQLEEHKDEGYVLGDEYGQSGLENQYEKYLRGGKGARQVEVDNMARPVRDLGVKAPVPGSNLQLTIDSKLQEVAEKGLADTVAKAQRQGFRDARAGAVVMLDVHTGQVLAMASCPSYDPAKFTGSMTQADVDAIFRDPTRPFFNRALGIYPPGSTFKMIVAAAALEDKIVSATYAINDPGHFRNKTDWNPAGHGRVDMRKAIQVSCDVYFWQIGLSVGVDRIGKFAADFGLGQLTGIDLPGESSGVVPTPAYKHDKWKSLLDNKYGPEIQSINEKYDDLIAKAFTEENKEKLQAEKDKELKAVEQKYAADRYAWELEWREYDTLDMSIGQGDNQYSPIQLANYISAIANGGTLYQPYIVKKITDSKGSVIKEFNPVVKRKVNVSEDNLQIIREGMHMVSLYPNGTAAGIFAGFPISVAAKTGTAEVHGKDNHALFVCFAPYEKPEVAIASVIDYGGHGGTTAGPVVRELLAEYFQVKDGKRLTNPTSPE
jgi:penicillin-binding protein 2